MKLSALLASANLFGTHTQVSQHDNASPGSNDGDDHVGILSDCSSDYNNLILYTHSHISQNDKACPGPSGLKIPQNTNCDISSDFCLREGAEK